MVVSGLALIVLHPSCSTSSARSTSWREYERGGDVPARQAAAAAQGPRGDPGVRADRSDGARSSLRTVVLDVPPQDVITRDNVSVKVNAVVYFRVMDPRQADRRGRELPLRHLAAGADDAAQRARPGSSSTSCCREREQLNRELQQILDQQTDPWGIKVSAVEVKHVDLPPDMQRAMARQAEAEREKRAKIIHAAGEFEASREARRRPPRSSRPQPAHSAPLPADADRDRHREELDDHLPAADRPHQDVLQAGLAALLAVLRRHAKLPPWRSPGRTTRFR